MCIDDGVSGASAERAEWHSLKRRAMEVHALDVERLDALEELSTLVDQVLEGLCSDLGYVLSEIERLFPPNGTSISA